MPHMLAEEQNGYVVIDPGLPRNQSTWAAALSTIGSSARTLVLTFSGDGQWNLASALTSPANVTTFIPPGVTVSGSGNLTLNGPVISYNPNWYVGSGTLTRGTSTPAEISAIRSSHAEFPVAADTIGVQVYTPTATPVPGIVLQTANSSGNIVPAITLNRNGADPTQNWTISNNLTNMFHVSHPGGQAYFAVTNTGSWFGTGAATPTPTHLLQLSANDAFMPGGGPWGSSSDSRLKDVLRLFDDGLAILQSLPEPVIYRYNGKASMPNDGTEYIGMIADDVQPVAPYMVSTYEAKMEPDDPTPTELLALNNGSLVYILMNAVRELATRVDALEHALIATAETRLTNVENIAHTHSGSGNPGAVVPYVPEGQDAEPAEASHASHRSHRRRSHD